MTHAALDLICFPLMRKRSRMRFISLGRIALILPILIALLLAGCAAPPQPRPNNVENICSIFNEYPEWYRHAKETEAKWGVPVATQMAIIYYESAFTAKAKPPRKKLLWIIPWKRPTSADGYSQALNRTWQDYQNQTGNSSGQRHVFGDACDFIGWYSYQVNHSLRVLPNNAYALYLAYHEGMGGYAKRTYLKKPWLIRVAHKVSARSNIYQRQLMTCESSIPR
jgi:hypothetical protein